MQFSPDKAAQVAALETAEPDVRAWPIAEDRLATEWPALAPCFEAAASATYGRWTAEDIRAAAEKGDLLVFAVVDFARRALLAVLCAQRFETPRKIIGDISFAGAHPAADPMPPGGWNQALRQVAQVLGEAGCTQIEFTGRPGWGRALGMEPTGAHFVIDLKRRALDG